MPDPATPVSAEERAEWRMGQRHYVYPHSVVVRLLDALEAAVADLRIANERGDGWREMSRADTIRAEAAEAETRRLANVCSMHWETIDQANKWALRVTAERDAALRDLVDAKTLIHEALTYNNAHTLKWENRANVLLARLPAEEQEPTT